MSDKKVWFITGAGRGMGVDFAKAALTAGHAVVASGRDSAAVSKALAHANELLAVRLDVKAGPAAIATAEQVVTDLKAQIEASRDLSTSLAFD